MPLQVGNLPYKFKAYELASIFNSEGFLVSRACVNKTGTGVVELIDSKQDKKALELLNNREYINGPIRVYILDAIKANGVLGRDYEDGFYYDRSEAVDEEGDIECIDDE